MGGNQKETFHRVIARTTGELYNADLSTIKLSQLSAWAMDNPHLVGRIAGYSENHPLMGDAQMEALKAFVDRASARYDKKPPLGPVFRYSADEARDIDTQDLALEKSMRIIARASMRLVTQPHSSEARVAQ